MRSRHSSDAFLSLGCLALLVSAGCGGEDLIRNTRHLSDSDGDGLMEEIDPNGDGSLIVPDPGNCPILEWTEIRRTKVDADGNVIEEVYEVCQQCFEADGVTPIGERECSTDPGMPPDVWCEQYDSGDPALACYRCVAPDGQIAVDECYPRPRSCASDADCAEGEICELGYTGTEEKGESQPGMPAPNDPVGICVPKVEAPICEPLQAPDASGAMCWMCKDPMTGETWEYCELPPDGGSDDGGHDDGCGDASTPQAQAKDPA